MEGSLSRGAPLRFPGLRSKRRDLAFDAELGDQPDPGWADDIAQVPVAGSFAMTEVVFFTTPAARR